MPQKRGIPFLLCGGLAAFGLAVQSAHADDGADTARQLQELREQNKQLQEQLQRQQTLIESLSRKVSDIQQSDAHRSMELDKLENQIKQGETPLKPSGGFNLGKINISGEGGVAFFKSGSSGIAPNNEFRIDEAKLFVDAQIWGDVYFFTEINLASRESEDLQLNIGELYLDWENISKLWGQDHALNLRFGRMDIPFGEEYIYRDAIDNPLISHSLTDFWGWDEGLELYGKMNRFSYALAVQNGGVPDTRDFDSDKAVTARIGFDPKQWLHLSVSGMHTGDLDAEGDFLSAEWFGGGFFRSIGSSDTTKFHADAIEGDISIRLPRVLLSAFGGYVRYGDNDPSRNNTRDIYYYCVEGIYDLTRKLYTGARFSHILAPNGYPVSGNGDMGEYFFNPSAMAENLWRLSLGFGYRWNRNLVTKLEYTFERGKELNGANRNEEDLFAIEAAFKF